MPGLTISIVNNALVVLEICSWTCRQTDRQTDRHTHRRAHCSSSQQLLRANRRATCTVRLRTDRNI